MTAFPRVVVTESLDDIGIRMLAETCDVMRLDRAAPEDRRRAMIAAAERLRVIGKHGVTVAPTLDDALAASDVVSIHLPLTTRTRGLIGSRALALIRPGGYVVNVGRDRCRG